MDLATELDRANALIQKRGALVVEDDGFRWVDQSKLPERFVDYYTGLVSACYARGLL